MKNEEKKMEIKIEKIKKIMERWLYNHKDIGSIYLIFSIIAAVIGTWDSVLIRTAVAYPGMQNFQGDTQGYNVTITGHAFIMIFFMVMPALIGGFGNWLVLVMEFHIVPLIVWAVLVTAFLLLLALLVWAGVITRLLTDRNLNASLKKIIGRINSYRFMQNLKKMQNKKKILKYIIVIKVLFIFEELIFFFSNNNEIILLISIFCFYLILINIKKILVIIFLKSLKKIIGKHSYIINKNNIKRAYILEEKEKNYLIYQKLNEKNIVLIFVKRMMAKKKSSMLKKKGKIVYMGLCKKSYCTIVTKLLNFVLKPYGNKNSYDMDYLSILQKNINKNFNDLIYKKLFGKNYDIIKIRDINKMEDFEKYKGDAYYINNKIFILENKKKSDEDSNNFVDNYVINDVLGRGEQIEEVLVLLKHKFSESYSKESKNIKMLEWQRSVNLRNIDETHDKFKKALYVYSDEDYKFYKSSLSKYHKDGIDLDAALNYSVANLKNIEKNYKKNIEALQALEKNYEYFVVIEQQIKKNMALTLEKQKKNLKVYELDLLESSAIEKAIQKKNLDIVNYVKLYDLLEITAKGLKNSSLDLKKKNEKISQQIEKIKKIIIEKIEINFFKNNKLKEVLGDFSNSLAIKEKMKVTLKQKEELSIKLRALEAMRKEYLNNWQEVLNLKENLKNLNDESFYLTYYYNLKCEEYKVLREKLNTLQRNEIINRCTKRLNLNSLKNFNEMNEAAINNTIDNIKALDVEFYINVQYRTHFEFLIKKKLHEIKFYELEFESFLKVSKTLEDNTFKLDVLIRNLNYIVNSYELLLNNSIEEQYENFNILEFSFKEIKVIDLITKYDAIIQSLESINYDPALIKQLKLHQNIGLNINLDLSRVLYNKPELYLDHYKAYPEKFGSFEAYKMQKQVEIDYNYETMFENVKEIMSQLG